MKRLMRKQNKKIRKKSDAFIFPFDTSLLPNIISFGHVKGIARIFLQVEIIMAIIIVIGTCTLVLIHLL